MEGRTTKYVAIASELADEIQKMPPGARCPGIVDISARWGVARATAEKVLRHLADAGYVRRVIGSGTYTMDRRLTRIAILPYSLFSSGETQQTYDRERCLQVSRLVAGHMRSKGYDPVMIGKVAGDVPDLAALDRLQPSLCVVVGAVHSGFVQPLIGRGQIVVVSPMPVDLPVDIVRREYGRPGQAIVRTFLECGLSDIHLVDLVPCGTGRNANLYLRTSGFADACRLRGVSHTERMHISLTAEDTADTVRRLLWQDRPPQVIYTLDARTGSLVVTLARKIGLRVPEDISVFSNFGLDCARVTCLVVPVEDVASATAIAVCHRLENLLLPPQTAPIPPRLLDRGTVSAKVTDLLRETFSDAQAEQS